MYLFAVWFAGVEAAFVCACVAVWLWKSLRFHSGPANSWANNAIWSSDFDACLQLFRHIALNPFPPSDAVRKQKKKYFRGSFLARYCQNFNNITPVETKNVIIYAFSKLKVVDSRPARSAGRVRKCLQNPWKFLCLLQRVYTIMQGHENLPCFTCGRVLDLQKHAKSKFYKNMAKTSFLKLFIVVTWSVTPIF